MITTFIIAIHLIVCVTLILIILLQSGKGADIGAVFGGGSSQTVFGSTGAATFLSKITIVAAVTFMVTSILLTYYSGRAVTVERSIMSTPSGPVVPGEAGPAVPGGETGGVPVPAQQPSGPAQTPSSQPAPEQK
jgi:preprotein translocase subunit SecG